MPRPTQCAVDLESRRVKGGSLHRTLTPCRQAGALQDSCPGAQDDGGGVCGMVQGKEEIAGNESMKSCRKVWPYGEKFVTLPQR